MKHLPRFILLLVLMASLAACKPAPTPTALPTDTPVPTVPPTATLPPPTATTAPISSSTPAGAAGSAPLTAENIASAVQLAGLDLPFASKIYWSADSQKIGIALENAYRQLDAQNLSVLAELPQRVLAVSPDGSTAAVSPANMQLQLLDVASGTVKLDKTTAFQFGGASFSPDGSKIMLASMETWAGEILDAATGSQVGEVTGFTTAAPVYNVSYGPDGTQAVWVSRATVQLSEIAANTLGPQFNHEDFLSSWVLIPARHQLITTTDGDVNGTIQWVIYTWDTQSGENTAKILPGATVNALAVDPTGHLLAAGAPGGVLIYDLADAALITTLALPGAETVTDLAFSPDGKTLAVLAPTASGTTLTLWGVR